MSRCYDSLTTTELHRRRHWLISVPLNGFSSMQTRESYSGLTLLHGFVICRQIELLRLTQVSK